MDAHLKALAEVSLQVAEAEAAVEEGAFHRAGERVDAARAGLDALRGAWPAMDPAERRVVGTAAAPVRTRLDAAARRIPRLSAVSEMDRPEADPEQDAAPDELA